MESGLALGFRVRVSFGLEPPCLGLAGPRYAGLTLPLPLPLPLPVPLALPLASP